MRPQRLFLPLVFGLVGLAAATAALGASSGIQAAAPGAVIISEVMQNPSAASDGKGEWLELFNPTGRAVDLNGWSISDAVATQTLAATPSLLIPAGGFFVLGRSAVLSENGGVAVDFLFRFNLNNDQDSVVLRDQTGQVIDRIDYDQGAGWPDPNGASMMLISATLDNNLAGSWIAATEAWPGSAGDFGTPGLANMPGFRPAPPADHVIYLPAVLK